MKNYQLVHMVFSLLLTVMAMVPAILKESILLLIFVTLIGSYVTMLAVTWRDPNE